MDSSKQTYVKVPRLETPQSLKNSDDADDDLEKLQSSVLWRKYNWIELGSIILGLMVVVLVSSTSGYLVRAQLDPTTLPSNKTNIHCADIPEAARNLACEFDLLTNNWTPRHCYDPVTDAEFRNWVFKDDRLRQSFPYYSDPNGQYQISSEEALSDSVGEVVYTTMENHLGHCTFLMRRLHRVVESKDGLIAHNNLKHTIHCSYEMLKAFGNPACEDRGNITSGFMVGAVGC